VAPVAKSRNLQADVTDDRVNNARLVGQFHDSGKRLVGTWNDDLGFRGVFALERLAE
jgi:hypothetical protein